MAHCFSVIASSSANSINGVPYGHRKIGILFCLMGDIGFICSPAVAGSEMDGTISGVRTVRLLLVMLEKEETCFSIINSNVQLAEWHHTIIRIKSAFL